MLRSIENELAKSSDLQSLQYLAAVRVAILVCESKDVQCMARSFIETIGGDVMIGFSDRQWEQLRDQVKRNLHQIAVPNLIIEIALENLWPISFEVFKWIRYHSVDIGIASSPNFCWTSQANIDYVKTAKMLIKNEALDIEKRFKLACFYCLESEVSSLWDMMTLSEKRIFYNRRNLKKKTKQNPMILYWTYYVQELPAEYWDNKALRHTHLFKYAVWNGYLSATKYFLGKLKPQLRSRMLSNSCTYLPRINDHSFNDHFAIAYFLINEHSPTNQESRFFTIGCLVFYYFLEWPMQKHFMFVVHKMRDYIYERMFLGLLEGILKKDIGGFKDYNYKKLFMEVWQMGSENLKRFVNADTEYGFRLLEKFVKKRFRFVFDAQSFALKAKFEAVVFQEENVDVNDFEKEDVDLFTFFVRERIVLESTIERLSNRTYTNIYFQTVPAIKVPVRELLYLMDGILRNV